MTGHDSPPPLPADADPTEAVSIGELLDELGLEQLTARFEAEEITVPMLEQVCVGGAAHTC